MDKYCVDKYRLRSRCNKEMHMEMPWKRDFCGKTQENETEREKKERGVESLVL
jgi:hypothetical protein